MPLSDYRTAVVTGASRGIGAEVVRALAGRGLEVHAVARSAEALTALAEETGCRAHALDVSDADRAMAVLGALEIDVLVNNAGIAAPGASYQTPEADWARLLDVNVRGLVNCLRAAAPGMAARDRGHIVNMGSVAGLYAMPGMPAYSATKAAVHSLSQTLRLDLFGKRVRVTEIAPGRVETGIHAVLLERPEEVGEHFYQGYESIRPKDIADVIVYALDAPAHVDLTLIEIMPTLQVAGGLRFHKSDA